MNPALIGKNLALTAGSLLLLDFVMASGDDEAGYQTFQIPLPGARQRFVKVVDVENQRPFRRGVETEVGQVRVAAELHVQT